MEFIPQLLVVGIYTPVPLPGGEGKLIRAQINSIWADVTAKHDDYLQLQIAPDGTAAQFLGASERTGVTLQPPLLQVRDEVRLTPDKSAEKAQDVLEIVARGIGAHQFFNAGIKTVSLAEPPEHDARGFLLGQVLGAGQNAIDELGTGGELRGRDLLPPPSALHLQDFSRAVARGPPKPLHRRRHAVRRSDRTRRGHSPRERGVRVRPRAFEPIPGQTRCLRTAF